MTAENAELMAAPATTGMTTCPDCGAGLLDPQPHSMFPDAQAAGMELHFICGRSDRASGAIVEPSSWTWREVERPAACVQIQQLREQLQEAQQDGAAAADGYAELAAENERLVGRISRQEQSAQKLRSAIGDLFDKRIAHWDAQINQPQAISEQLGYKVRYAEVNFLARLVEHEFNLADEAESE